MGIGPVAVRVGWIIVEVADPPRDQLLKCRSHIVQESGLELVDEEGDRSMETVDEKHAVADAGTVHDLLNVLRDVKELLTLLRVDLDRFSAHFHRRPPPAYPRPVSMSV